MCKYLKSTYTYIGKIFNWFYFSYFLFFFFAIVGKKVSLYRIGSFLSVNFKMRERKKKEKEVRNIEVIYIFIYSLSSYFVRRYDKV